MCNLNFEARKNANQLFLGLLLDDNPALLVLQLVGGAGLCHRPADDDLLPVQS